MQYYTRQQLQGGGSYAKGVKCGNWNEDTALMEAKLREFVARKEEGALPSDKYAVRMRSALMETPLTVVQEGECVHFGDLVQLMSKEVQEKCVLSADVGEADPRNPESFSATCSLISDPCARNTFTLRRYQPDQSLHNTTFLRSSDGPELCYGELVLLELNPAAQEHQPDVTDKALYLSSCKKDPYNFSKVSHNQEVRWTSSAGYNSAWKVLPVKAEHRDLADGEPVLAGAPVVLKHAATNVDLCCDGTPQLNDFGRDYETCCHVVATTGKQWKLLKEFGGTHDALYDVEGKSPNHFIFLTGNL